MGLDNGLILLTRRALTDEELIDAIQLEFFGVDEDTGDYCYELAYWRKNYAIEAIGNRCFDEEVSEAAAREFASELMELVWDSERERWDSAFSKNSQQLTECAKAIANLGWAFRFMEEHPHARVEWYDSY